MPGSLVIEFDIFGKVRENRQFKRKFYRMEPSLQNQ